MQQPILFNVHESFAPEDLKVEIIKGLESRNAFISPKFLYDKLGSHLFTAITQLPEYYPTKTEREIFQLYQNEIAEIIGENKCLIDLGAGNCEKSEFLFESLKPSSYVAIDFSIDYLKEVLLKLSSNYPDINMMGLGMDFSNHLLLPDSLPKTNRLFFYPGSSIGNFTLDEARNLLIQIKSSSQNIGLLLGIDLFKDESILSNAYDDPLKLTSAFNLNILRVVNGLIKSNFDVRDFRHRIKINHEIKRVELYLEVMRDLKVTWPGGERIFQNGELIHTENSHKYTVDSIHELLRSAGFTKFNNWTDPENYFAVIYAQ